MIAKTFLRLERDFDKHVVYCRDEPLAQEFLAERDEVRNYFKVSKDLYGQRSEEDYLFELRVHGIVDSNCIWCEIMCAIYRKIVNKFYVK